MQQNSETRPAPPLDNVLALRVNDAARAVGISRASIYRLIAEKKLASRLVAGRRVILKAALENLISGDAA